MYPTVTFCTFCQVLLLLCRHMTFSESPRTGMPADITHGHAVLACSTLWEGPLNIHKGKGCRSAVKECGMALTFGLLPCACCPGLLLLRGNRFLDVLTCS